MSDAEFFVSQVNASIAAILIAGITSTPSIAAIAIASIETLPHPTVRVGEIS
ncbi:MAG: hypothetical protein VKK80_14460 [Prochlorothrix sp.]|nr:hypothetical protein [Prochlorothrix sp.]